MSVPARNSLIRWERIQRQSYFSSGPSRTSPLLREQGTEIESQQSLGQQGYPVLDGVREGRTEGILQQPNLRGAGREGVVVEGRGEFLCINGSLEELLVFLQGSSL